MPFLTTNHAISMVGNAISPLVAVAAIYCLAVTYRIEQWFL